MRFFVICNLYEKSDNMKKSLFLLFILIFQFQFGFAQSPYKLSYAKDVPIYSAGIALGVTGQFLKKRKSLLDEQSILKLNRNDINSFDRNATYNWNTRAAHWSDGLMFLAIATPLLFTAGKASRNDFGKVAAISSQVFIVNLGITNFTKEIVKRKRPYMYNENAPMDKKMKRDSYSSFFSGHTSTAASMSFAFAQMHSDYYPNSKVKPFVWFSAATLPLATGILRNRAGKHYWSDIIVGYLVGMATGIIIPRIHRTEGFFNQ